MEAAGASGKQRYRRRKKGAGDTMQNAIRASNRAMQEQRKARIRAARRKEKEQSLKADIANAVRSIKDGSRRVKPAGLLTRGELKRWASEVAVQGERLEKRRVQRELAPKSSGPASISLVERAKKDAESAKRKRARELELETQKLRKVAGGALNEEEALALAEAKALEAEEVTVERIVKMNDVRGPAAAAV